MSQFPQTLKTWRKARRFSQLDLALEADVSTRHISFLETGRAQPSREMIGRLGDALNLPLESRNLMLTHAGFAARYPGRDWHDDVMMPVRAAVSHVLTGHAPFPALALDRLWNVVEMNEPAGRLFGMLSVEKGSSLLDLMMSDLLPTVIENWPEVAHHSAQRLRIESISQGGVTALDRVVEHLSALARERVENPTAVVPTVYNAGGIRFSLFSTIAQFGSPADLTLDDLKIELFFPNDKPTEDALRALDAA
ncbi:MAG: helix-turn-helix transcriptional regulator [Pseudomonadota bacterium]